LGHSLCAKRRVPQDHHARHVQEKGRHYRKLVEVAHGIEPLRTALVHPAPWTSY